LFRAAERQVFMWIQLYVVALLAWIEEFCETVPLVEIAEARAKFGFCRPELNRELRARRDQLLEWAAVMQIIEQEHLHAPILPDIWRSRLDPLDLDWIIEDLASAGGRAVAKPRKPAECLKRARAKVATLLATACATADITACHQLILSLTRAQLTLVKRRKAWKEFSMLLESQKVERDAPQPPRSD
jgi:hypothetical protein